MRKTVVRPGRGMGTGRQRPQPVPATSRVSWNVPKPSLVSAPSPVPGGPSPARECLASLEGRPAPGGAGAGTGGEAGATRQPGGGGVGTVGSVPHTARRRGQGQLADAKDAEGRGGGVPGCLRDTWPGPGSTVVSDSEKSHSKCSVLGRGRDGEPRASARLGHASIPQAGRAGRRGRPRSLTPGPEGQASQSRRGQRCGRAAVPGQGG